MILEKNIIGPNFKELIRNIYIFSLHLAWRTQGYTLETLRTRREKEKRESSGLEEKFWWIVVVARKSLRKVCSSSSSLSYTLGLYLAMPDYEM